MSTPPEPTARRIAARSWPVAGAIAWGLAAVALPKCPACVAAYLAWMGVGLGLGTAIGGILPPLFIGLALTTLAWGLARRWSRRRRHCAATDGVCRPASEASACCSSM